MNQTINHGLQTKKTFLPAVCPFVVTCVLCLVSCVWCPVSEECYAQTAESDLIVDEASFDYYKIIEQRNFFRPKKDIENPELESESELKLANNTSEKNSLDFILTGVIEIKSGYKAIVEQKSSKKGFYVSIDEAIEDYTVKAIMLNRIVIEKNGKEFELKLQQGSKKDNRDTNTAAVNSIAAEQIIDIDDDISLQKTLRENTIQQIRSGTRGTK